MNRARRLAYDVARLEPEFAAHWSGGLPYRVAVTIATEVLNARAPMEQARVTALFDALLWNLVDDDEELEDMQT